MVGFLRIFRIPRDSLRFPRVPMDSLGFLRIPKDSWGLVRFLRILRIPGIARDS